VDHRRGARRCRRIALLRKQLLWGAVLIILGLLVGPGGVSLFS
jgi:hypothetical protein